MGQQEAYECRGDPRLACTHSCHLHAPAIDDFVESFIGDQRFIDY
jgi:hypothetical protein